MNECWLGQAGRSYASIRPRRKTVPTATELVLLPLKNQFMLVLGRNECGNILFGCHDHGVRGRRAPRNVQSAIKAAVVQLSNWYEDCVALDAEGPRCLGEVLCRVFADEGGGAAL